MLWREEFSLHAAEERYVARRQFGKFLVLAGLGMFAGNVWILVRSLLGRGPTPAARAIARAGEVPVGGVKISRYPEAHHPCLLLRTAQDTYVAYSQKCTHLSCAVIPKPETGCLHCPCHEGNFDIATGKAVSGPPRRPLPKIHIERRGDELFATAVEVRTV